MILQNIFKGVTPDSEGSLNNLLELEKTSEQAS